MKLKIIFVFLTAATFLCGCSAGGQTISYEEETSLEEGEIFAETASESSSEEETIYVSIQGEVCVPGVYVLPAGSRVYELINLAGGVTEDADTGGINMVYPLEDGMQIIIPATESEETLIVSNDLTAAPAEETGTDSGLVNINTADLTELESLPGIGETRAAAIIAYREEGGTFETPEDLMKVSGIKSGIYEGLKDRICVK